MHDPISPQRPPAAPSPADSDRRLLIAAGVAQYPKLGEREQLPSVSNDLGMMVELFEKELQYEPVLPTLRDDPSSALLRTELEEWFTAAGRSPSDIVVLYYSGHGVSTLDGEHYLVTSDCDGTKLTSTALATSDLGRFLRESPVQQFLLLIDTCDSGQGVHNFLSLASAIVGSKKIDASKPAGIYAIAACLPRQLAEQSAFAEAFRDAVLDAIGGSFAGGETQRYLYISSLIGPINERLRRLSAQRAQMSATAVLEEPGFIRNPRYRPNVAGQDLQTRRHADFSGFWDPRARGLDVETQHGYFFTGRREVMSELVGWLTTPSRTESIIVTGQPGCGKSAVLARLVTLSDPEYRTKHEPSLAPDDPAPPLHSVFAAVRCSAKRLEEIAAEIGAHFGNDEARDFDALREAIGGDPTPRVLVVDALDEALEAPRTARALLAPLSKLPGLRLLVGTREAGVDPLGPEFRVLDLDHPENLGGHDVADYVSKILLSETSSGAPSPYAARPELAANVAETVARRAGPNFLVARIVACSLVELPEVVTDFDEREFPAGVGAAFAEYLGRFGDDTPLIRDVLTALAFAQGSGLPWETIWPTIVKAVTRREVSAAELESAIERAGAFIIEDNEAGRSVYRLFHEALADHLRAPYKERLSQVHRAIADALVQSLDSEGPVRSWPLAHPYLKRYLIRHAALGGYVDILLRDPWFVVSSRPADILRALPAGGGRDVAGIYKAVVHRMREANPYESLSYLEMAAQQAGLPDAFDWQRAPAAVRRWRPLWASWEPDPVLQRAIAGHADEVTVLAALPGERTIVASGGWDRTVLLWDLATGIPIADPLPHRTPVRAAAFSRVGARDVVITAAYGAAIRMWYLDDTSSVVLAQHEFTTALVALPFRGRPAVAFGTILGELVVIDLASGETVATAKLEPASVYSLTLHALDKPTLVIGGHAGAIWSWQPERRGAPVPFPNVEGETAWVAKGVAATVNGKPLLVADGNDGIVLWDPAARARLGTIATGSGGAAFLTSATIAGRAVAVVGQRGWLYFVDLDRGAVFRSVANDVFTTSALLVPTAEGVDLVTGNARGVLRVRELGHDVFAADEAAPQRIEPVSQVAVASNGKSATVAYVRGAELALREAALGTVIPQKKRRTWRQIAGGVFDGVPAIAALSLEDEEPLLVHAATGTEFRWKASAAIDSIAFANFKGGCVVATTEDKILVAGAYETEPISWKKVPDDVRLSRDPDLPYVLYSASEGRETGFVFLPSGTKTAFPFAAGRCVGAFERDGEIYAVLATSNGLIAEPVRSPAIPRIPLHLPPGDQEIPIRTVTANGRLFVLRYGPSSQVTIAEITGETPPLTIDIGAAVTSVAATPDGYLAVGTERGVQVLQVGF